jgi:LAO/AO transport system kinase
MTLLARNPAAFIRPSPSQTHLGGVARRTRETVKICEVAGFDVILIETVGVGQSETIVSEICDIFTLLLAPAGGDELQGVKRGIMELADIILVNKADGELKDQATRTCADYSGALRLLRKRPQDPEGFPKAMTVSAIEKNGISETWDVISDLVGWRREKGYFQTNRTDQSKFWLLEDVKYQLLSVLEKDPVKGDLSKIAEEVASGKKNLALAANQILQEISIKKGELG